jgi:Papain family cysteine protease
MRQALLVCSGAVVLFASAVGCRHSSDVGEPQGTAAPVPVVVVPAPGQAPAPNSEVLEAPPGPNEPRVAIAAMPSLALNAPSPAPLGPPPVRRAQAIPNLPNLPPIAKYPKAMKPPRGPDMEACGSVWSGTEWITLECADPTVSGRQVRPSTAVIPYDRMRPPIEQLPAIVDHRAEGTEGPVRKQQGTLCTAFAFTSALDHSYARWTGTPGNFSVMQVWGRYHSHQEQRAANFNVGDSIGNESDWPFDGSVATKWRFCHPGSKRPEKERSGIDCDVPVDQERLQQMEQRPVAIITKVEFAPTTDLGVLREKLAAGQDVSVSVNIPSFATAGEPGAKYIVGIKASDPTKVEGPQHQILLAGYAMTPNGTYYLVHNSFGTNWGDNGYGWLHEEFLKAYWSDNVMVIPYVEPLSITRARADARGGLSAACPGAQVPDSISGACVDRCPDGSPRHNNICGRTTDCLKGQINLTGECLLAAPSGSGMDPASRVSWSCGPGGCAYSMPGGVLSCAYGSCAVSCPAPDFRLATTPHGFGCVD